MKEQDKTPERQLSEVEKSNLLEKEEREVKFDSCVLESQDKVAIS